MFTGLVEAVGELIERKPTSGGFRLRIAAPIAPELSRGDSVAVNGVCLTVILADSNEFQADIGPESVRVSTLGALEPRSRLNLERPLRPDADFHWLTVSFPSLLAPYIVHKGSIAVDGISLTVAGLGTDRFDVQVVPYTMSHTNLGALQIRDRVNLECDMVGKYVVRAAELAGLTIHGLRPGEVAH
ncbi:MAG: riboflavin synthase [Acidobacteria bacterium]|nr:MAG: riboflavin synthase [Acidobacteriota bacterium]